MTDRRLQRKRLRAERRFRLYGLLAISAAVVILLILLGSIIRQGVPGFMEGRLTVDLEPLTMLTPASPDEMAQLRFTQFVYARTPTATMVPPKEMRQLFSLAALSEIAKLPPQATGRIALPVSDAVTRYLKGQVQGDAIRQYFTPEQENIIRQWRDQGRLALHFDWDFLGVGDSREPELAGFLASAIGSIFIILVCIGLAFPLGVATAIYLEEFAPKHWLSDLIEVNINNLAAVPSIVFGLLGLALYLNFMELPRSSALVGGLTLALLVLPVIIIATRAALRAVPPSIRDAARGLGASELQVATQHVFPLALPGIMTGTILGIARALGETAPLLMIGMVAFIADVPRGVMEPTTAMPVQIYLWASSPEVSFVEKTAAGIMVLLALLFIMNMAAVWLRRKFERRW